MRYGNEGHLEAHQLVYLKSNRALEASRCRKGWFGLQVHRGFPATFAYRIYSGASVNPPVVGLGVQDGQLASVWSGLDGQIMPNEKFFVVFIPVEVGGRGAQGRG